MPDNTIVGEACDGHHPTLGVKLSGHSLLIVRADINDVTDGLSHPWMTLAAPAYEGISQMPKVVFTGIPEGARCGGGAMWTVVRREDSVLYLDYEIEVAEPPAMSSTRPAAPWKVQGRLAVNEASGTSSGRFGFSAFGHSFTADVQVTPGPVWTAEANRRAIIAAEILHPRPRIATPLPDEMPGRTLLDVTRSGNR